MNPFRTASPRLPFGMLILILVLAALDQTILSTALPVMARELPGHWPLAWAFSAYLLAATVVIVLYGRLADVLGRKPMLLLAIALFLLGSLACGASQDMRQLILARALQGAGGGGLMTLTMLVAVDLFGTEQRGRYQGLLGAAYGVSTMFGPLVGGALVQHLSWHWAFWMNVPLALIAWSMLALTLPARPPMAAQQPHEPRPGIDWTGAVLLAGALVSLLMATQHDKLDLPAALTMGSLLAIGALLTAAFLWRQQSAEHPLLPLSLFSRPPFAAACFVGMANGVALYCAVVFLPLYLQTGLHLSPTGSAWHLLPLMAGVTVAAITSGRLLRAQKPVATLARIACVLMLLSFGLLVATLRWLPDTPLALSASLLPLGLGLGVMFPIVTVVAQRVSPVQHTGIATAVPVMLRSLGGAAGLAVLAALLVRTATRGPDVHSAAEALAHGLQPVFGCAAAIVLLSLIATRWLPKRRAAEAPPAGAVTPDRTDPARGQSAPARSPAS